MGEYAEMMLDGTCCACCGEYIGSDNGFATYCTGCAPDFGVEPFSGLPVERLRPKRAIEPPPKPCVCGTCGKPFKSKGARKKHRRAVHPTAGPLTPADASQVNPGLNNPSGSAIEAGAAGQPGHSE